MAKINKRRKAVAPVTPMEFVGSQMSNFLHNIAYNTALSEATRSEAKQLQLKWDTLSNLGLRLNPIVAAELEKKLFARGKSA
jgi:hypothetical protein